MKMTHAFRVSAGLAGVAAGLLSLSGCTSGPTYGTDKTSTEQLFSDLGSAVSLGMKDEKEPVKYNPRPGLVVPAQASNRPLVTPQASLASRENNPQWSESPEEMRARLRREADENADNPNYRSPLLAGRGQAGTLTETEKWQAFRDAKAEASPAAALQRRRYLSDPPPTYRQPAETAQAEDLGEPEEKKAKRRLKEAQSGQKSSRWWMPFQ